MTVERAALEREARLLTRHLLGRDCPAPQVQDYVRAHALPVPRAWQSEPDAASRFALARPWALGPIDAAGAVTGRAPVLRAKLLLLTAILEASPDFADAFLARREPAMRTVLATTGQGLRAAAMCLVGLPLVAAIGREAS